MGPSGDGQHVAAERAETYLRALAETALRHAKESPASAFEHAEAQLRRMYLAALTLTWTGTLDNAVAESLLTDLKVALAARWRTAPQRLPARYSLLPRTGQSTLAPAGEYRNVRADATLPLAVAGATGELHLLTLVTAPGLSVLTAAVSLPASPGWRQLLTSLPAACSGARATDSLGHRYLLRFIPDYQDGRWGGQFQFSSVLPPKANWVEVRIGAAEPVRIGLRTADSHTMPPPAPEPAQATIASSSAQIRAESFLDGVAIRLLTSQAGEQQLADLSIATTALGAAGLLQPGSPALARLVTLVRALGLRVPRELTDVPAAGLPAAWVSALRHQDLADGPVGEAAAGAVLAGPDNVCCVTTRVSSGARSAALYVLAWGWPMDYRPIHPLEPAPFSWMARDDLGRWHLATRTGWAASGSHAIVRIGMRPPLDPRAASLEIVLSGVSGTVSATVPLSWRSRAQ